MCGACTVLVDGDSARACLMFAVQADGCRIETVEGLGTLTRLNPLQEAFREHHALQCGFCTPGMLMTATDLIRKYPLATDDEIRAGLSGNLCRCTGYEHIVRAIRAVVGRAEEPAAMKMHILSGGRVRIRKSIYFPGADRSETIELPVSCVLLRHPQGNVLFDTGCHPSVAENPEARWGGHRQADGADHAARRQCHRGPRRHRPRRLATSTSSCARTCIRTIAAATPSSRRATFVIHARELEAARAPEAEASGYLGGRMGQRSADRCDRGRARPVR